MTATSTVPAPVALAVAVPGRIVGAALRAAGARPVARAARSPVAGFTLIELMVVLALMALMMGAATVSLRSVLQSELRSAAARTAAALAAAFDRAAISGRTVRVALDLDRGALWLETANRAVALVAPREGHAGPAEAAGAGATPATEEQSAEEGEEEAAEGEPEAGATAAPLPFGLGGGTEDEAAGIDPQALLAAHERDLAPVRRPPPAFRAVKGAAGKPQRLGRGVEVEAVLTPRLEEAQAKGVAYVYCFAQGQAEPAVVVLRSGEESYYSVTLHPLSGRARVHACRVALPRDFGDEEAAALLDGRDPCEGR
ncbi:MAG: prepilin-type N-terminal cleavage/methylation domain-containing protein [Proteobacteria bacterium]|nr:prepilin-type N-terminal cleavage/methylation domain-containing protein [Pseudomonadota bacterium]